MALPALADLAAADPDWQVFAASAVVTLFVGMSLVLAFRMHEPIRLGLREAFLLTAASWTGVAAFAAIPFAFSNLDIDYTDAFFEAISGITTTGSTVLSGLDDMPRGILLWRSLLQWIGGVGIIVMAIAMLPLLRVGGMQLFRTESSDRSEKVMPRLRQVATALGTIYVGLSAACALAYWTAGMNTFDAMNHAMTTVATGGYSTSDSSFGRFGPAAQWIGVVFMLFGALTFTLYIRFWNGEPSALWRDSQVRWFLSIAFAAITSMIAWTVFTQDMPVSEAVRASAFNVISIITTTGYASTDYMAWGTFAFGAFYFLTFVGGCTGSTSGAIKIFRFQVLHAIASQQLARLLAPHRVTVPRVQGKEITEEIAISVLSFFFFYAITFALLALALGLFGLDPVTALSGATTTVGNVGPGLGDVIGPAGNFASLPNGAKWVLSAGMLLGRLEFVTVFVLLTRSFWRP